MLPLRYAPRWRTASGALLVLVLAGAIMPAMWFWPDRGKVVIWLAGVDKWTHADTHEERVEVWHRMLDINRDQMFTIGIVNHVPHPVVVSNFLHNLPDTGFYDISPGAYFGIYKPDTFWFDEVRR